MHTASVSVKRRSRFFVGACVVYCSLAGSFTFAHTQTLSRPFTLEREAFHTSILTGNAHRPYQYRVLAPFTVELLTAPAVAAFSLQGTRHERLLHETGYALLRLTTVFLFLVFFHLFLRNWFSDELALAGTLLYGALYFFTMHRYYYQPSSGVNLMMLALFCHWLMRGVRASRLALLAAVASLARETSGIVAALYLAKHGVNKKSLTGVLPIVGAWVAVQVSLRLVFGLAPGFEITRRLADNLQPGVVVWPAFLFLLLWGIPFAGYRRLPPFFQRAIYLLVPSIVIANLFFGEVEETRLFLDLGLVLIPASFLVLFGRQRQESGELVYSESPIV